jgi:hypothetical protein
MIRIKIYPDEEYYKRVGNIQKKEEKTIEYSQNTFKSLMHNCYVWGDTCPPFRNEISRKFLKETYDVEFVDQGDWYSVTFAGDNQRERTSLWNIDNGLQYGLCLLHYSQLGVYLSYNNNVGSKVWNAMANMPFDILIAIKKSDVANMSCSDEVDFLLENYPYQGKLIEVTVTNDVFVNKNNYRRLSEVECGIGGNLCIGKDGKYYGSSFELMFDFEYYWQNDIEKIIQFCQEYESTEYLVQVSQESNIFDLGEQLHLPEYEKDVFAHYLFCLMLYEKQFQEGKMTKEEYDEAIKNLMKTEDYETYLYYLNDFKVIHHLLRKPQWTEYHSQLPELMVDKNKDGTYCIRNLATVSYPGFDGILCGLLRERNPDRETYCLIVDEKMNCARNLEYAVFGCKITQDQMELFDKDEAIKEFGKALKEAYESGRYTVKW